MKKRHQRRSKKRALIEKHLKALSMEVSGRNERVHEIRDGECKIGVCGTDAACRPYTNNTYTCLCPHDSLPPTKDYRCPTRHTVPLEPRPIENIVPPKLNETKIKSGTNKTSSSPVHPTSPITESPLYTSQPLLISSGILLFLILIILITLRKRCIKRNKNSASPSPIVLKRNLLVANRYAPNPQYSACTSTTVAVLRREALNFLNEIGEGCFGKVYKGELKNEISDTIEIVAIKVLKESATREAEEDFLREVDIMSAFKHNNILSLLGVVLRETNVNPMMVFEYMPHGDLAEVLRSQKKRREPEDTTPILSSKDLLYIALQIASGMKYLAAQRFVHRDLACRNCLVSDGPIVKIADFGMSRDVYTCDYYRVGGSRLMPVRWMPPESIIFGRFTLDSDIWSYGIVLWEIFSFGKQPYYGHTNEEVVKLILDGIMLIPPDNCPPLICKLMENCWKTEPKDRSRFLDIYEEIERSLNSLDDKLNIVSEIKTNTLNKLPRPPPLNLASRIDLLDTEGYLMPKEIKEPVQYLETLPD